MIDSLDSYSVSLIVWLVLGGGVAVWLLLDPRWLDEPRDARRVSGLLTTTIGIAAALIVVFAPLYTETTVESDPTAEQPGATVETTSRLSLWEQGLPPEFAIMLAVFAGVMIIVGRCAVPQGREHSREALALLWVSAFVLLASAAITIMSVGLILIPVALLAFVTAIHQTRARSEDDSEPEQEYQHSEI